jgi:hypothetical protein
MFYNTAGNNTAVGYQAGFSNTTGTQNVVMGRGAMHSNSTGSYNVGLGYEALVNNTTASENTAVGYQAAYTNTTGASNSVLGWRALSSNTTGSKNVAFGLNAGFSNTTGTNNTFVGAPDSSGFGSGHYITTGSKNTILGAFDGNQGGLDIRTSSNNIVLSDGDGNVRAHCDSSGTWTGIGGGGGGKVLQVVSTINESQVSGSANVLIDAESATITPTATTSKIIMMGQISTTYNGGAEYYRYRGTTQLGEVQNFRFASEFQTNQPIYWVDSPNSTSALTYKISYDAGGTHYVNASNGATILILMEIDNA